MTTVTYNNPLHMDSFKADLERYELAIPTIQSNPLSLQDAAFYLKKALQQMIYVNPLDTFQMMRWLASRMNATEYYTDNILMFVSDKANEIGGSDIIRAIPYKLNQVSTSATFEYDELWFGTVNFNTAVKMFMSTYTSSDLYMLKSVNQNNIVKPDSVVSLTKGTEDDAVVTLSLGKDNFDVSLTAFQKQKIKVNVDPNLTLPQNYDNSLPLTILSTVTVKAGIKEFFLDKAVTIPESTLCVFELFPEYLDKTTVNLGNRTFKFPNHFYSYELDLISFNSGDTWVLGNILVKGPKI